jgi:hypothetical protein
MVELDSVAIRWARQETLPAAAFNRREEKAELLWYRPVELSLGCTLPAQATYAWKCGSQMETISWTDRVKMKYHKRSRREGKS